MIDSMCEIQVCHAMHVDVQISCVGVCNYFPGHELNKCDLQFLSKMVSLLLITLQFKFALHIHPCIPTCTSKFSCTMLCKEATRI